MAASQPGEAPRLLDFRTPVATTDVFRSALCFWEDDTASSGVAVEAGPWAIAEYLAYPAGCRFIQSFKSVAESSNFERAAIFEQRYTFEALKKAFLGELTRHAGCEFGDCSIFRYIQLIDAPHSLRVKTLFGTSACSRAGFRVNVVPPVCQKLQLKDRS